MFPHPLDQTGNSCGTEASACRSENKYKGKIRNVTENEIALIGDKADESESSISRTERINRIVDKNKNLTTTVKTSGKEKECIKDIGSSNSIRPTDNELTKELKIQRVKHRYQVVNKNGINFRGKIPVEIQFENNKQKIQTLITEKNDRTPMLEMDCLKKFM